MTFYREYTRCNRKGRSRIDFHRLKLQVWRTLHERHTHLSPDKLDNRKLTTTDSPHRFS